MTEDRKPSFELSIDTRLVYDRLKQAAIGEVVSFRALKDALGREVEGSESSIQSAVRRLLKVDGIVFENVRGVGYKRLADIDIVRSSESMRDRLRRGAKRMVRKLACVQNFDALPNDLKVKHNAAMSGFGAVVAMMSPGRMKKLEQKVEQAAAQLPLAKTLEVFRQ